MKVSFESSYKPHQSGSYNPPTAAVIIEHGVQFQHHGVKNQHWGVKNGPPYPLSGANKQKAKTSYKKPPKNPEKEGDYKPESSSSGSSGPKARKDEKKTSESSKKNYEKMSYSELESEYDKNDGEMMKRYHEYVKSLENDKRFKKGIAKANKIKKEIGSGYSSEYWRALDKVDRYIMEQDDMKEYSKKAEYLDELMRKKGRY